MTHAELLQTQDRFAKLRWLGVLLFIAAIPILLLTFYGVVQGVVRPLHILPAIGCLGLSLGSFGTANDTSLHAARSAAAQGALPPAVGAELAHEVKVRPARLDAPHSSPKAALVVPLVALGLIVYMGRLLSAALG